MLLGAAGVELSTPASPAGSTENPATLLFGLINVFGFGDEDFWASFKSLYSFCAVVRALSATFFAFSGRLK